MGDSFRFVINGQKNINLWFLANVLAPPKSELIFGRRASLNRQTEVDKYSKKRNQIL